LPARPDGVEPTWSGKTTTETVAGFQL